MAPNPFRCHPSNALTGFHKVQFGGRNNTLVRVKFDRDDWSGQATTGGQAQP
jgi:hypothetical protein